MSKYYGCMGCGQEQGRPDENNFCKRCDSPRYFGWMSEEE